MDSNVSRSFYVTSSCSVYLVRELQPTDNLFTFVVRVTDDRIPNAKTDDAQVTVRVTHVKAFPIFQNLPFKIELLLSRQVNTVPVLQVRATDQNLQVGLSMWEMLKMRKREKEKHTMLTLFFTFGH